MLFDVLVLLGAVFATVAVSFVVYLRNPYSTTHRLFVSLGTAFAAWSVVNYLSVLAETNPTATWLVRGVMFFSVPIGVLFYLLMDTYPRPTLQMPRRRFYVFLGLMTITMLVSTTPLLFPTVEPIPGHPPRPSPGIGMVLYVPVVIGSIIYGLFILGRKFINSRGLERIQLGYLLVGVVTMFSLIIGLNFVAVNIFDTVSFIPYAPLFTLPFTLLTAYTIIRHRMMDIRLALLRALSLAVLVGAVLGVYGLLVIFAVPVVAEVTGIGAQIVSAAAALFSIPVARMIQNSLTRLTDKYLFQTKRNYAAALVLVAKKMSRTIEIKEVNEIVLSTLRDIIRTSKAIIFMRDDNGHEYRPSASYGVKDFSIAIPHDNPIVEHMRHEEGAIIKDELALQLTQEKRATYFDEIRTVKTSIEWLDASVIVPLFIDKGLTGFILLGEKISGAPYLKDDADFLSGLGPSAATALQNAQLYQESQKFGEKLKVEVSRATHELELANRQLKDLDKAKSEFLSVASHQLYTPLTALRGYLSMLNEGDFGKMAEKQGPVIDILNKSTSRLITLIKNLLDISRIESGRLELKLESVDFTTMAQELVEVLLPNAKNKGLILEWHPPSQRLPTVVADRERLRQVMLNFVDNAIKYTPSGRVDVSVKKQGDELIFGVTDSGRGISAEEIGKLFTKFTRVGGNQRLKTEGTGLGLYVARQIVREHHGEVEVTSPGMGKGSTFAMHMPAEGTPKSLKIGDKVEIEIKAAEVQKRDDDAAAAASKQAHVHA